MGKKGVLLDNGKKAQSSMALYWKAGKDRAKNPALKPEHEQKEEAIEDRVSGGMQKWKVHKEKMINKLYTKPEKKDEEKIKADEMQKQRLQQQEMDRDLLERETNKYKPTVIPGFKGTKQLQNKMKFQEVKVGQSDNNKLILPAGQQALTQEDIIQMLRERKAKKELEKNQKQVIERRIKAEQQLDMLRFNDDELEPKKQPEQVKEPEKEEEKIKEKEEEKSIFKSELLQRIEKGNGLLKKQVDAQQVIIEQPERQEPLQFVPKFVPRALWNK